MYIIDFQLWFYGNWSPWKKSKGLLGASSVNADFVLYDKFDAMPLFLGVQNFINIFKKLIKNCYPKTTFIFLISCLNQGEKKRRFISNFDLVLKIPPKSKNSKRGQKRQKLKIRLNTGYLFFLNFTVLKNFENRTTTGMGLGGGAEGRTLKSIDPVYIYIYTYIYLSM